MSREFDLARTAATGATYLLIGKIVSRIVSGLGSLILIRLLMPLEYGLLSVALVVPSIILLFSDFNTNAAMVKYVAEYRSKGKTGILKPLVYSNLLFHLALGLGLTLACYVTANLFATVLIRKPYVAPLIRVAALYVMAQVLYNFAEASLIGFDATKGCAALMVLSAFLSNLLPVLFVVYGMGVLGVLFGWGIAIIASGLIGIFAVVLILFAMKNGSAVVFKQSFSFRLALKEMLMYGMPLWTAFLISAGVDRFYDFMIATYRSPDDIGLFTAATGLSSFLTYLTFPISTVLFPTFSKVNIDEKTDVLRKVYNYSVKYSSLIILPAAMMMLVLARPLVIFLFGVKYEGSSFYLMLLAAAWFFYGLGKEHLWQLLKAQGEVRLVAKLDALQAAIGVTLGLILIPIYGILGFILIGFVSWWPSYIIAFKKSFKKYGVRPPLGEALRIYFSVIVGGLVVALINYSFFNELLKLMLGILVGAATYIVVMPITKAIKTSDINALRGIVKRQPFIGTIADKIFIIMERIANLRH